MPMLFAQRPEVLRAGSAPNIRGFYAGYTAPSFPPAQSPAHVGSKLAVLSGGYAGYAAPSFPPAQSPARGRAACTHAAMAPASTPGSGGKVAPSLSGGWTRLAYNQPPYFNGLGADTTMDWWTTTTNWVSANPGTSAAIGGGILLLTMLGGGRRR